MVMNPRTHPRGAPPDFTLPRANPNPSRMTNALWWLVCMRLLLEPGSQNGGTYADKPGSHNAGENLPDYGAGDPRTDHSIRHPWNRTGPWWREFTAAHDWTFPDAHSGDYSTISRYTNRLIRAMRDPDDVRPDNVVFYTLGQADSDRVIEGYNEIDNESETSGDLSHLFHRHDSLFRNAVGDFWRMWQLLTIDMGWTVDDWQRSLQEDDVGTVEGYSSTGAAQFKALFRDALHEAKLGASGPTAAVALQGGYNNSVALLTAVGEVDEEVAAALAPRFEEILTAIAADDGNTITLSPEQVTELADLIAAQLPGPDEIADAVNDDAAARLAQ